MVRTATAANVGTIRLAAQDGIGSRGELAPCRSKRMDPSPRNDLTTMGGKWISWAIILRIWRFRAGIVDGKDNPPGCDATEINNTRPGSPKIRRADDKPPARGGFFDNRIANPNPPTSRFQMGCYSNDKPIDHDPRASFVGMPFLIEHKTNLSAMGRKGLAAARFWRDSHSPTSSFSPEPKALRSIPLHSPSLSIVSS